jgi:hypothetical protein
MAKKRNFLRVPGGIDRSKFKIDRTDLALNWQFDSTSEKVISSPANVLYVTMIIAYSMKSHCVMSYCKR